MFSHNSKHNFPYTIFMKNQETFLYQPETDCTFIDQQLSSKLQRHNLSTYITENLSATGLFPAFSKKKRKTTRTYYTRTSSNFSRGIRAPRDLIAAARGDRLEIAISLSTSIVHARARLELVLLLLETGFIGGFSLRGEYTGMLCAVAIGGQDCARCAHIFFTHGRGDF